MIHLVARGQGVPRLTEVRGQIPAPAPGGKHAHLLADVVLPAARHLRAARRLLRTQERLLAPARLTTNQFAILAEIEAREPETCAPDELAAALLLDGGTLTRTLRTLERDRCVQHTARPVGRMELTTTGRDRLRLARPLWARARARLDATLGEPAAAALRDLLALFASLDLPATLDFKTKI